MKELIAGLLLYAPEENSILEKMARLSKEPSSALANHIVKEILITATDYGFDENLWQNYLTYTLITNENPFSLTCEKTGATEGASVNHFAMQDFEIYRQLFHYDFSELEKAIGSDSFSILNNYKSIKKSELMYNKNVSEKVQTLSKKLAAAHDAKEFFDLVTQFYKDWGVGMFGLNKAFRLKENNSTMAIAPTANAFGRNADLGNSFAGSNVVGSAMYSRFGVDFSPVNNMEKVVLDDLVGYEIQKKKLVDNTVAFIEGRECNNVLLFGDSGTGKSTSIKAIVNEYYDRGLRMIEIYKHQFKDLSNVIAAIKNRNYRFIIYMDDLSFEEFEIEYKFLKAVIEGGVETKPENILIYATSNRRHLIKETWSDRSDVKVDNGMHKSDTMEEKLSLVHRFGVTINYSKPSQKEYFDIAVELCHRLGVTAPDDVIKAEANKWELSHGGISGRTADQFAKYMAGTVSAQ